MPKCINCGHDTPEPANPFEIEPLYDLPDAARRLPMRYSTLVSWLRRHKEFPRRYRKAGPKGRLRIRLISASEILRIREMTIVYRSPSRSPR